MIARLPWLAFLAIYLPTCYLRAILLLLSGGWISIPLPDLTQPDARGVLVVVLVLLHVPPVLLWMAAEVSFRSLARRWPRREPGGPLEREPPWLAWLAFLTALAVAGWSLHRADALSFLGAWFDYATYLAARRHLMARLTFFEFVNLYTVLPLAGAYVLLVQKRRWWATVVVMTLIGLAQYPLAQRRVLLTSALLMGAAWYVHAFVGPAQSRVERRRPVRMVLGGAVALYAFFVVLSLQWSPLAGATVGLLNRYAVPAIQYVVVFPRILPYYHVDIGLDMVGIGRMPDDSIQVAQVLAPGTDRTVSVPFQFVLYSQGGVLVALVGSLIMGALLGGSWAAVLGWPQLTATRSLLGALVMTLGAFLAMDSVRNAVTVSYGLAWGVLMVAGLHVASRLWTTAAASGGGSDDPQARSAV
jgi:hypothetical protein